MTAATTINPATATRIRGSRPAEGAFAFVVETVPGQPPDGAVAAGRGAKGVAGGGCGAGGAASTLTGGAATTGASTNAGAPGIVGPGGPPSDPGEARAGAAPNG